MFEYVPILRPREAEQTLIEDFAVGFERFDEGEDPENRLLPLVEVTRKGVDLVNFQSVRGQLLVDFPRYLSDRSTVFSEDLDELLEEYNENNIAYFRQNEDRVDIPVLSATTTEPVVYRGILDAHRDLHAEYSQIAVRPFITRGDFDETQKQNLESLLEELRPDDILLLDVIDIADFDGQLYENLQWLINRSEQSAVYLLNAFEPQDGQAHNLGPVLTQDLKIEGFGDFVTDPRYPTGGGGSDEERSSILRQYDPSQYQVEGFKASTYAEALDDAKSKELFDADHCNFCSDMDSEDREWSMIWKVYRMGHYIATNLEETLIDMENLNPEVLDEPGYRFVRNRIGSSNDD